ncbi:hydroxyproline-rich glycoprotein family protein isoform X2 [Wolffia australiana]
MEEAEKRKERLRAARIEGSQPGTSSDRWVSSPAHLFNPLTQTPASSTNSDGQTGPSPRFDYYTDPLSAYSGSRGPPRGHQRQENFSPGGRGFPRNNFQGHQFQQRNFHEFSMRGPPQGPPWRNPQIGVRPFSSDYNSVGVPPMQYRGVRGSSQGSYHGRGYGRQGGHGNSSYGRGGRGRGNSEFASARERPDLFANKMMVTDPWRGMEPVVGCILVPTPKKMGSDDANSWLPSSIRMKKVRVEGAASEPRSHVSLAQSIALAFEEAAAAEEGAL